jgi:hypothetical protein
MNLSSELISQFVKATKDEKPVDNGSTVYGMVVEYDGKRYVKLDGSDQITPVASTSDTIPGDRVSVLIKNHTATVTGNITSPAARTHDVQAVGKKVDEFDNILADTVTTEQLTAMQANIDLVLAKKIEAAELEAYKAEVDELFADTANIGDLNALRGDFEELESKTLTVDYVDANFAKIGDLDATNAKINTLEGTFVDVTGRLEAAEADIKNLDVESLDAKYVDTVFSNIEEAAIEKLFSDSGIIGSLRMQDGVVTGELTSVSINADTIIAGTLLADRIAIKGENGLLHVLNASAQGIETELVTDPELLNKLHGDVIVAKSITTNHIDVSDLSAFDATIGGFDISSKSIHSIAKDSVEAATNGLYMDRYGQLSLGDDDNFVKCVRLLNCTLTDSQVDPIDPVLYGERREWVDSENRDLYEYISADNEVEYCTKIDDIDYAVETVESFKIEISAESIYFGADDKSTMDDIKSLTEHVKLGKWKNPTTGNIQPSVELAEGDSTYRQVITNTASMLMDGDNIVTKMDTDGIETENVTARGDIRQGNWSWNVHGAGNLGLMWKEASS